MPEFNSDAERETYNALLREAVAPKGAASQARLRDMELSEFLGGRLLALETQVQLLIRLIRSLPAEIQASLNPTLDKIENLPARIASEVVLRIPPTPVPQRQIIVPRETAASVGVRWATLGALLGILAGIVVLIFKR